MSGNTQPEIKKVFFVVCALLMNIALELKQ